MSYVIGGSSPPRCSLDQLNFEQRRQLIASTLSLSDLLGGSVPRRGYVRGPDVTECYESNGFIPGPPNGSHNGHPPDNRGAFLAKTASISLSDLLSATKPHKAKSGNKTNGTVRSCSGEGGMGGRGPLRSPPPDKKPPSRLSAFGRLFKPWKWKRRKKSDKFELASRNLERRISMRANKEDLVQRGILMPDSAVSPLTSIPDCSKEKLDGVNGGVGIGHLGTSIGLHLPGDTCLSPADGGPLPMDLSSPPHERLERPSSLLAPAGKWPANSQDPPATETLVADAAASSSTCGGRHARWLLCVSAGGPRPAADQYRPSQPPSASTTPGSPSAIGGEADGTTSPAAVVAMPRSLPSPSCNLTACFLKPSGGAAGLSSSAGGVAPPARSPSPHLPPGLPSPLPPGFAPPPGELRASRGSMAPHASPSTLL